MATTSERQKKYRDEMKKKGYILKGVWVRKRHLKALKKFLENLDKKTPS